MEPHLLRYIWRHTRPSQIWLSAVILASMPVYFLLLDIPKRIINGPIQGKGFAHAGETRSFLEIVLPFGRSFSGSDVVLFGGFHFGRIGMLFALSIAFLVLVVLNGGFKLYITTYKGRIGERLLRRLRYEMIDRLLRFPPWHTRRIRSAEIAGIIKDEVDPLSDFIGDSFSAPLFLAGQALTGLAFLFLQNMWFGLLTLLIVALQVVVIPRLRRKLIHLGRERQAAARRMATRIGEIVQGTNDLHVNDMSNRERADFIERLTGILDVRLELYRRKFSVKFLNNLLMQFTSVLFYLIGGYFVVAGRMDVGALVASIAAYKDLPTPIKGLIDWDQQRLLSQVRYAQALEPFHLDDLPRPAIQDDDRSERVRSGFELRHVSLKEEGHAALLDDVSLEISVHERVGLVSVPPEGAAQLLAILARLLPQGGGTVLLDGNVLGDLPESVTGRALAYVDAETFLPAGTIRDSLLAVLRNRPVTLAATGAPLPAQAGDDSVPASRLPMQAEWIDLQRIGLSDEAGLDLLLSRVARRTGLYDEICEIGLNSRLSDDIPPETRMALVADRELLHERLRAAGLLQHVEFFENDRYLTQASIGENIVFGIARDPAYSPSVLAENAVLLDVLDQTALRPLLLALGRNVAATFAEMFETVSAASPVFGLIGAVTPERIAALREILERSAGGMASLDAGDRRELLRLALDYNETSYRFGLLGAELQSSVLDARRRFQAIMKELPDPPVVPHDRTNYDASLSILDNVIFGLVATRNVGARARVFEEVRAVLKSGGHWNTVFEAGLLFGVGSGGRGLSEAQRQKLRLARALLKKPDMLILNRACSILPRNEQQALLEAMLADPESEGEASPGIVCMPSDPEHAAMFDRVIVFEHGRVVADGPPAEVLPAARAAADMASV